MGSEMKKILVGLLVASLSFVASALAAKDFDSVQRSTSLREAGLVQPLTLNDKTRERHFYLPIAQNAQVEEVVLHLDAVYFQQFSASDGLTVLINGVPAYMVALAQNSKREGVAALDLERSANRAVKLDIPVTGLDPRARFVDVGISFNSRLDTEHCTDVEGRANELLINPQTSLSYRFKRSEVRDVRTFLTTLPKHPKILLPSLMSPEQYEAALRLMMGMRRQGLLPQLLTAPAVGGDVEVSDLTIPADWHGAPFFAGIEAAITEHVKFHIASDQDQAAWLAVGLLLDNEFADVVLDASSLRIAILKAEAVWVGQNVTQNMPLKLKAALAWAKRPAKPSANLSVVTWLNSQMLMLDAPEKNAAALLTGSFWADIANSSALKVNQVRPWTHDESAHRMLIAHDLPVQYLQGSVRWELPFSEKDLPNGKRPNSLEINILSAHREGDSTVVSIFMNDFLLTAKKLREDGEVTAVTAFVPLYTLRANNVVRVEVINTAQKSCTKLQPLPVQILPSSFLGLGGSSDVSEFFSLLPHLNENTTVVVPPNYLQRAEQSLQTVTQVLQGLAMSAHDFKVEVIDAAQTTLKEPFVSFEVEVAGLPSLVEAKLDHLVVRDKSDTVRLDSHGMGSLAVVQIIGTQGVLVSRVGRAPLNLDLDSPLQLSVGNLAILDNQGVKLTLNSNDSEQEFSLNESGRGFIYWIEHFHVPFVILGIVLLIALAFLTFRLIVNAKNRKNSKRGA